MGPDAAQPRGLMRGFAPNHVLGTFTGGPDYVHGRPPTATLADIRGKHIHTNSDRESTILNAQLVGAARVILSDRRAAH